MADYNPILPDSNTVSVKYQMGRLIREAFPSLASTALYKIEGLKDVARDALSDVYNGYKIHTKSEQVSFDNSSKVDVNTIQTALDLNWDAIIPLQVNQGNVLSYLGLPIFQPIYFMPDTYRYINNGQVKTRTISEIFRLPAATLCEFDREKIIELIELNGGVGTEKELWAFSDWQINIRGFVMDEGDRVYPEVVLNKLALYESLTDSIAVSGGLFDILKIRRIVIKKISIGQIQGSPFKLSYSLQCISDEVPESRIKNNRI